MNKIKLVIMTTAIFLSLGSAFVKAATADCVFTQQYYLSGSNYVMTGVFGHDYYCDTGIGACTYILSGGNYVQCRIGSYLPAKLVNENELQKK